MTRACLKEPLREMVLKQASNCTFGGKISQGEIAHFRIIRTIKQARKNSH